MEKVPGQYFRGLERHGRGLTEYQWWMLQLPSTLKSGWGGHAEHIDINDFQRFLELSEPYDRDIMLEIKDKEASALAAISLAKGDRRFVCSRCKH